MQTNTLILTEERLGPRLFDGLITAIAWAGFLYFVWKNLLLQLMLLPDQRGEIVAQSLNSVLLYLLIAAINGWLLILWYQYSLRRYSDRYLDGHKPFQPGDLARSFNLSTQLVSEMSRYNQLTVYHDQIGQIIDLKNNRAESEADLPEKRSV
ncbi:poly-beta-1,6-N-acetyl-D-glucosamine biosynthesis protein PgaD [Enterobacter sp. Cy-643]|uniref:poly-beta-1,6-N-acetyl-D-glucosamine biosynthesis protein PgaD n=1 Tax=Enterobacter sp. Cy-643 TaxID=2608346 RepID=UPI001423F3A4|nr:poly-beta-1,6-N-acetyl-D-glucosamine biosynthesis protein PgaD [Enterobacter sp. Cy-643]NIF31980.1 poly-beta-1,6-N-acetyl-D-glucosamine biosynthesis protein PgaD [Enterobacter sp. Cy-643]